MSNKKDIENGWLKKIFTAQNVAIFVAVIGVIIAYMTLKETERGKLSIELYNPDTEKTVDISDASSIFVLYLRKETSYIDFMSYDEKYAIYLPHVSNKTNKSLRDFHCIINVQTSDELEWYYNLDEEKKYDIQKDINPNYSFAIKDDIFKPNGDDEFVLEYKENILRPHESLPIPIKEVSIPDEGSLLYVLNYQITYDGLDNPLKLTVEIKAFEGEVNKAFLKTYLTHLDDFIRFDSENENTYNAAISMIYSDEDTFGIIKDNNFLKEEEFAKIPFYKFVSKVKGF